MNTLKPTGPRRAAQVLGSLCLLTLAPLSAHAEGGGDTVQAVRTELERMKAEQAERAAEMQKLEARLAALEATAAPGAPPAAALPAAPAPAPVAVAQAPAAQPRLAVSGDFRLRYESNFGDADGTEWDRGVLRARLGATYVVSDRLTVGARLATGDPDDPNSSDVTLSNFADDFQVSLDQAYARYQAGDASVWGGKFALPFIRTDLVWDADVNPQGVGATYAMPAGAGTLKMAGLYFLVDQSVGGADSSMWGGQLGFEMPIGERLRFDVAGALYDYTLPGVAGADFGDFRSNLIGPDGKYLSDFNLFDVIAGVSYQASDRWPLRLVGEYVKNEGARTPGDTGYSVEVTVGRTLARGDWRFGYGYSVAEVDAVLAAFSQDNTTIGTNYRQHALTVDYSLTDRILLDATYYRYRPYDAAYSLINDPDDWLDRFRLNFQVGF
jgi:hypothetical protein